MTTKLLGWTLCLLVSLCQKIFFLQNMGRTCCVQKLFWMSETISVHNMYWTYNSMKNLLSYCGLVDAKIKASDKDLPVCPIMSEACNWIVFNSHVHIWKEIISFLGCDVWVEFLLYCFVIWLNSCLFVFMDLFVKTPNLNSECIKFVKVLENYLLLDICPGLHLTDKKKCYSNFMSVCLNILICDRNKFLKKGVGGSTLNDLQLSIIT